MPWAAKTRCVERGCPNLKESGPFCRKHAQQAWKKKDEKRGGTDPFYASTAWRMMRRHILSKEPLCRVCKAMASVVDHILSRKQGGADLDEANLQPLCAECHDRKRGYESREGLGGQNPYK